MRKPLARSRLTNTADALPRGLSGRSSWGRRFRDLVALHLSDLGGVGAASEAEKALIRRSATVIVELERIEVRLAAADEVNSELFMLYLTGSNTLKRLLDSLGLQRRPRDITPDLDRFLELKSVEGDTDGAEDVRHPASVP